MNPRLNEIQDLKKMYRSRIRESTDIGEMLEYTKKIDELEIEEKNILQ